MAAKRYTDNNAAGRYRDDEDSTPRRSTDSAGSVSSTSAILEHIHDGDEDNGTANGNGIELKQRVPLIRDSDKEYGEEGVYRKYQEQPISRTTRNVLLCMCALSLAGWLVALFLFLRAGTSPYATPDAATTTHQDSQATTSGFSLATDSPDFIPTRPKPLDSQATPIQGPENPVTFDEVQSGRWYARSQQVKWIKGAAGEDGLIMVQSRDNSNGYLVVEDVRSMRGDTAAHEPLVLMEMEGFEVEGTTRYPSEVYPSPDLKKVLIMTDKESNWRHSSTGLFWIFDVETQNAEPVDPRDPLGRMQLASWSPTSDAVVFTRDNNMYHRKLEDQSAWRITHDGGPDLFYGVPDWVYEEEVFAGKSGTWWSDSGKYIAYLRTNDTVVPEYPVQYFVSRPSGHEPPEGLENYPEVRQIKYPKAGAPNPIVSLQFFDVERRETFNVDIADDYADDDRLITEVVWGTNGTVLVRETNRISTTLKIIHIDMETRSGKTIREADVFALDGGWFEVSEYTKFIPADPANGREYDGYIDTVIHEGYDHLAYFTPVDSTEPIFLTKGKWEVVDAPSSIDLKNNLVYFVATKVGPGNRHVYSVKLDGTDMEPLTDESEGAFWTASFSAQSGYAVLTYRGPQVPNQRIVSTQSLSDSEFEYVLEDNSELVQMVRDHDLPKLVYSTVEVDGFELQVVERRPPNFDETKKYPVLFYLYNGPGSQQVDQQFKVDFQSYVASNLGYIVVTVDGRGTGFQGRAFRTFVRGNIGHWEAHDQVETAKIWAAKDYVDSDRMAIWGWSYGGFMTLKVLEYDAGRTFKYGMAVAPVTDWRFYDSIYTERYMDTPQRNPSGYENATVSNMTALASNVRFLLMHGVADDNVHLQNSLTLLDKLDLEGVENYDFHAFPDSDHSIYFHNANRMVYGRLNDWLINAFNGEWLKIADPLPLENVARDVDIDYEYEMASVL